jgi:hypothetical protein
MNCSQLSVRRAGTTWEKPAAILHTLHSQQVVTESIRWTESPELQDVDASRWSEVRAWAHKLTAAHAA